MYTLKRDISQEVEALSGLFLRFSEERQLQGREIFMREEKSVQKVLESSGRVIRVHMID